MKAELHPFELFYAFALFIWKSHVVAFRLRKNWLSVSKPFERS